ncbi:MAG: AraC family transcriptional regulator [Candidatus Brocadiia bacterium]
MIAFAPHAIVMQAGFFYVGPARSEDFPAVYSRPVVRCIGGEGKAHINGEEHDLKRGNVIFMPWKARVEYRTAAGQSMVLSSCHIIPDFRCDGNSFTYTVAHSEDEQDELGGVRRDAPLPGLEGVRTGYLAVDSPLRYLTNFVAARWGRDEPGQWEARYLARLLLHELREHFCRETRPRELSQLVQQALDFIDKNFSRQISTRDVARHLRCSPSTVTRHFRRELDQTPTERIHKTRIKEACRLLATSRRYVGEIARMVGVNDPYYFSKLFRRYRNMTPTEYRQRNMVF